MRTTRWTGYTLVAGVALAAAAHAEAQGAPGGGGHRGPPPEAIQACAAREDGAACTVPFTDGRQLTGTCRQGPNGEAAACMPSGPAPGGHRGPPPEAIEACTSQQDGASCSFSAPDGAVVSGTCRAAPDGSALACRPSGPPPGR